MGCVSLKTLFTNVNFYIIHYGRKSFYPLLDLCKKNYIVIIDSAKNDITKMISKLNDDEIIKLLESSIEDTIFVKLTDKLPKIQSFLGFSLRDTIKKIQNINSVMITPFFDYPDSLLKTDVFVIMPFQDDFNHLYQNHIKKVCTHINASCMRADDLYSSKPIMQDIWSLIYNSTVIIADCTNKNPNVMYELGIAHAIGKEVILITQNINDIPFDLRNLRHLSYKYIPHLIIDFEFKLEQALLPYI